MRPWSVQPPFDRLSQLLLMLLPVVGLLMVYSPTILSGFERMQMYPDDTVFNHVMMEHTWRWLTGHAGGSFWDPPFGYPLKNIKATSDLLLSFAPAFWIWRLVGVDTWTSFSLWMICMSLGNYVVGYLFLRRCFGVTVAGGALGAFVFAFAAPRTGQLNHQQLIPHVFLILVVWGMMRALDERASTRRRAAWIHVIALALVAQLHGALYNFEFICVAMLLALIWALILRRHRPLLWRAARLLWPHLAVAVVVCAALSWSTLSHYLEASRVSMIWHMKIGEMALPRLQSWLHVGAHSWLYGWMTEWPLFHTIPSHFEHVLCAGYATTLVAVAGLWAARRLAGIRLLALVAVSGMVLFTLYPGDVSFWPVLYYVVPGLEAIRLPTRIGMLLLIPLSVGIGCWFSSRREGWRMRLVVVAAAVLCCVEQGGTTDSFKVSAHHRSLTTLIHPAAEAFVVAPANGTPSTAGTELLGMWAALHSGKPTINLHTSAFPNSWPLLPFYFHGERHFTNKDIHAALMRWLKAWSIDPARVLIIELQHDSNIAAAWAPDYVPAPVPQPRK